MFDFCFAENGLSAYRSGKALASKSFIDFIGEERYQELVNFLLHYIADLKIPKKRCASFVRRSFFTPVLAAHSSSIAVE